MNAHIESLHLDVRPAVQKIDQINEKLHNAQPHLSSLQQAIEAVQKLPLEIQEKINYFDDKNFVEKRIKYDKF
jgi:prefoldin subunit 5